MDPPVEAVEPPPALIRVVNPVLRRVLGSPFGRLAGRTGLMLVRVTGRRTGRRVEVPVGRHELPDGTVVAVGGGQWRKNFAGGSACELVVGGRARPARGELSEDPDDLARVYAALIERVGLRDARRLGLRITDERTPTHAELVAALRGRRGVVRFTPAT